MLTNAQPIILESSQSIAHSVPMHLHPQLFVSDKVKVSPFVEQQRATAKNQIPKGAAFSIFWKVESPAVKKQLPNGPTLTEGRVEPKAEQLEQTDSVVLRDAAPGASHHMSQASNMSLIGASACGMAS